MSWIPLAIVGSSLVPGIIIFFLAEGQVRTRTALNLLGAVLKVALVLLVYVGIRQGETYEFDYDIGLDLTFRLHVDPLALLFAALSAILWLVTTVYAIGYLEGSAGRRRFFGFFSICVTASTGIALSGNMVTFFIFYEFLTIATYPLVVHRGTARSLEAGRIYLLYTISGGTVLFVGVVWLSVMAGPVDFGGGGESVLAGLAETHAGELRLLFWTLIAGLGVKAALVPLHGWLPVAMVAPAPVSALLHAVAVVKAGAFGIVRVVYDVFGLEVAAGLGLLTPLAVLASITIVYGSIRALAQDDLKKRLAYSTISQLSYITLGISMPGVAASTGALVHLVHQGIMKITLFFCAGNIAETLGLHRVSELRGVGRRMPMTMSAFTIGACGMIGLPPVAGFVSKWYLGIGALESGMPWVVIVLLISSALNAAYFLPILYAAWFCPADREWTVERQARFLETPWMLLMPTMITALLSLMAGVLAGGEWSPLTLARQIADTFYSHGR
jgi:multicomponent Na+:H+ antiporter subunit D